MLDRPALVAVRVAHSNGDAFAGCSRRNNDAAAALGEDNVGAVGLGEARRAFEELRGVHGYDTSACGGDGRGISLCFPLDELGEVMKQGRGVVVGV